jgi:hypothetical protein
MLKQQLNVHQHVKIKEFVALVVVFKGPGSLLLVCVQNSFVIYTGHSLRAARLLFATDYFGDEGFFWAPLGFEYRVVLVEIFLFAELDEEIFERVLFHCR